MGSSFPLLLKGPQRLEVLALTSPRALQQLEQLDGSSRLSIPCHVHTKRELACGGVCSGSQGEAGLALLPWAMSALELSLTGRTERRGTWEGSLDGDAQAWPWSLWLLWAGV